MEIRNHHILITGCNRGIGRATALRLAQDKAHLHIANRQKDSELEAQLLNAGAASVEFYATDLSTRSGVQNLLDQVADKEIDCSGIVVYKPLEEVKVDPNERQDFTGWGKVRSFVPKIENGVK